MKITKYLIPLVLLFAVVFSFSACSSAEKSEVEDVIKKDLDLLKNVDSDTTAMYIAELSPDSSDTSELSQKIKDVFTLFFQNFDYKILKTDIDSKKGTATSKIRIETLDAKTLAKDFATDHLSAEILAAASQTANTVNYDSVEQRYLTLYQLLTTNEYDTVEIETTVDLKKNSEGNWEIQRTYPLENSLVGGLMTYLSDPVILGPDSTLDIYLNSIKTMDKTQIESYLGLDTLYSADETYKKSIADALVDQLQNSFDYQIQDYEINGYTATVPVTITTFDSDSIVSEYNEMLEKYLATPEAVIDGASRRYEVAQQYLLEAIRNNEKTVDNQATFTLINDGFTWHLQDSSQDLGMAVLGTMGDAEFSNAIQVKSETEDNSSSTDDSYNYYSDENY